MLNLGRLAATMTLALLLVACARRTEQPLAAPTPEAAPVAASTLAPRQSDLAALFAPDADPRVAYDHATQRAFVANAADARVDILDATNPTAAVLVGSIDVTPYGQEPTSVAVHSGLLAIGVEADKRANEGALLLADTNGVILDDVRVGPRPVAVAFTPDGMRLVVANQGQPNKGGDKNPEGSISIIELGNNRTKVGQDDVRTAGFAQFNDVALDPRIHIAPGVSVAQDLEPTAIAVAQDGRTAQIALLRNNAVAVVDLTSVTVTTLLPLAAPADATATVLALRDLPVADLPEAGMTVEGQPVLLGGFSALTFAGVDADSGALKFLTLTDRGPNASPGDVTGDGVEARPFPLPAFAPRIVQLLVDPTAGTARFVGELLLANADGAPLTGLPNLDGPTGLANSDERAIDLRGNPLPFDPTGIDPEGMAVAADGSYWIVEEYRPSILHFDAQGRLMRRYVPEGANANAAGVHVGVEALPGALMQRTANHGFEAAVFDGEILYIFMQSPIDNPDTPDDANAAASRLVRIVAFDTATEQTAGQYLYVVNGDNVDKIGDAVALGNGEFLVIERDDLTGPSAHKYIYRISLAGATNLEDEQYAALAGPNGGLETQLLPLLALAGIHPVQKQLYLNLTAAGYTEGDKLEGIALVDGSHIALINDDDFGMSGAFDPDTGLFSLNPARVPSLLTLIE